MRRWVIALAVAAFTSTAHAQDFEAGARAARNGDFSAALSAWRPLAEGGDAKVQFNVGLLYMRGGRGLSRDDAEAARWFRKAADQGVAESQRLLGAMYAGGRGVPKDQAEARKWLLKAAQQGDGPAQSFLSGMLLRGEGGPKDPSQAYHWIKEAATTLPPGPARDHAAKARDAMASTVAKAQAEIGQMNSAAEAAARGDYASAVAGWQSLAEAGDRDARLRLGLAYHEGLGVEKNAERALALIRASADQGLDKAQFQLGSMYFHGEGVTRDYVEARNWFLLAADQGHGLAQYNLGVIYGDGLGVPADYVAAYMWFSIAHGAVRPGRERDAVLRGGRAVTAKMTPQQIEEAKKRAREWRMHSQRLGGRK